MKIRSHGSFKRGRLTGAVTPYNFTRGEAGSWRIGYGRSGFLIAEGSAFSVPEGRAMLEMLNANYWQRSSKKGGV